MIESTRQSIDKSLKRAYHKFVEQYDIQFLTRDVDVDPTLRESLLGSENQFFLDKLNGRDKFVLAIFMWYMPEWASFLLKIQLEEEWTDDKSELASAMLTSKELMLSTLQIQEFYNGNDLFGNILNIKGTTLKKIGRYFRIRKPDSRPPKAVQRKRGYTDKGSRRPEHQPEPRYKDYAKLLTFDQNIEERVQNFLLQQQWVNRAIENLAAS